MKKFNKSLRLIFILCLLTVFFQCSFYIPGDFDFGTNYYKIILDITPDDSSVFLNGKFLGLAYEFSTSRSGLKFKSLDRELIIKKKGYNEKIIIPSDFADGYSNSVIIKSNLTVDSYLKEKQPDTTKKIKEDREYQARNVKIKEIDEDASDDLIKEESQIKMVRCIIDFSHADASIFIDDDFFGISPQSKTITNLHLTTGSHKITVFKPGFKVFTKTINVKADGFKIQVTLKK